jgi:hypothetical protein
VKYNTVIISDLHLGSKASRKEDKEPYKGYYTRVYDDFCLGFEIASKGGVLLFH